MQLHATQTMFDVDITARWKAAEAGYLSYTPFPSGDRNPVYIIATVAHRFAVGQNTRHERQLERENDLLIVRPPSSSILRVR
jgi:hypothetical protein